ncbi:TylF/MycF/NovP-related O-methyltransferase [Prosthecobacter sp.]|uniref:TylF/MycF/NovP-related O-methyltransferase n=1 Tax=Prosthecobacter sp. TaxID=1965333 RepID=UPI001D42E625|nr:TylF/MycF/NovP-related O-methyltransferase [Prosthecobacter sp.]MCB1275299.1 class I SAM-dependent methyltransferase [Prosthecobacter sp.]
MSVATEIIKCLGHIPMPKKPYKRPFHDKTWLHHLLYFKEVYDLIRDKDGEIVECGVGHGHSLYKLCMLSTYEGKGRKITAFDSFEGFPEPAAEDQCAKTAKKGQWKVATSVTIRQLILEEGKLDAAEVDSLVTFVPGFFENTMPLVKERPVAFLHLDVDLYESYKTTLTTFWPMIVKGGVVLFDEYNQFMDKWPGAVKAIDEVLGERAKDIQYNKAANRHFIVK